MLASIGTLLLVGLVAGKIAGRFRFPAVTGYILGGILIGPSLLNLLPEFPFRQPIEGIALSLIAIAIGGELSLKNLRDLGPQIATITTTQLLGAFVLVLLTSRLLGASLQLSLLLAALATATAPAATIAVIREYRAKGKFTNTLLAVVALDDAGCLIVYSMAAAFASVLTNGSGISLFTFWEPIREILGSFLLGIIGGLILCQGLRYLHNDGEILTFGLALAILTSGLATTWNLSSLLATMTLGMIATNLSSESRHLFDLIQRIEPPIYVAFFVLAGMYLQLDVLPSIGALGIGYVLARIVGKMGGAYLGASITKAPDAVRNYLGLALIPQAGVAIGLSVVAVAQFPELKSTIMTVILASVVVSEIIGPLGAKLALTKAGEIHSGAN
jgi:Kef-type K+ transport system membrane component KefB